MTHVEVLVGLAIYLLVMVAIGVAAIGTGLVTWMALQQVLPDLPGDLLAVPVAAATLVVVSRATAHTHPPLPLLDADGRELAQAHRLGI